MKTSSFIGIILYRWMLIVCLPITGIHALKHLGLNIEFTLVNWACVLFLLACPGIFGSEIFTDKHLSK